MKKALLKNFGVLTVVGLIVPLVVFAQGPGIPHQFYGTVVFESGGTPNGLTVEAKINDIVVGSSTTSGGNYGYNPNLFLALDSQNVNNGKTVKFFVAGVEADQTALFSNGKSTQLNLVLPGSALVTSTNSSGGGGGGSAITLTTPTLPLSEAAKKVDGNNDGKIDVLDFNLLMINWGSEGVVADFNGDGKVDVLDFNALMIHWTG